MNIKSLHNDAYFKSLWEDIIKKYKKIPNESNEPNEPNEPDSELNEIRRSISNIVELMINQNNYQKQILNIDINAQYRKINNLKADISNSTKELKNLTKFCSIQ